MADDDILSAEQRRRHECDCQRRAPHLLTWSRKLRSSRLPFGVSTDSGWNWTPHTGMRRVAQRVNLRRVVAQGCDNLQSCWKRCALDDE